MPSETGGMALKLSEGVAWPACCSNGLCQHEGLGKRLSFDDATLLLREQMRIERLSFLLRIMESVSESSFGIKARQITFP